jgi:hypothetical protein
MVAIHSRNYTSFVEYSPNATVEQVKRGSAQVKNIILQVSVKT